MVYFYTQNPNLGIFWRASEWKMLVCCMTIKNMLVYFVAVRYIGTVCCHLVHLSRFGMF
jgi:hypothetical protein